MDNMNPKENFASLSPGEDEIFARAIEIDSIADRNQYLDEACGEDSELRAHLNGLLREYEQPDSFFTDPDQQSNDLQIEKDARPIRFGDFQIIREIGRGGMGIVYEARQESLNRNVALKVLSIGLGYSSKAVVRFRREAEAAARLHHSNIVPIHYTGIEGQSPYNVMELINGPSLAQIIHTLRDQAVSSALKSESNKSVSAPTKPGSDDDAEKVEYDSTNSGRAAATVSDSSSFGTGTNYFDNVARVIGDVADALTHAHQKGVIHRDIKPSNLLLSPDGRLSITDFGLARLVEQPGVTMTGEFMGSPIYMSPEQIAHVGSVDHRTDIYSLGATLYELLTLRPPCEGSGREQILHQVINKEPKAVRRIDGSIPRDLETICRKAMEKRPEDRYQSADAMADDLRRFVSRHAISARRIGPVGHAIRWCRRNRTQAVLAAMLATTIVIASSAIMLNWRSHQKRWHDELARINYDLDHAPWDARVRLSDAMTEFPERRKELEAILERFEGDVQIESDDSGATIQIRPFESDTASWLELGKTPISDRLPFGHYLVRINKDLMVHQISYQPNQHWEILLPLTQDMVRIPDAWHGDIYDACRIPWLLCRQLPLVKEFEMDRTEISNVAYKQFVDAGGYEDGKYWRHTLGDEWAKTVEQFRDKTKQLSPRFWVNGSYPQGLGDHPVVGVSWYEAMAYAKWANKKLPTLFHWMRGADFNGWYDGIESWDRSNIAGRVGMTRPTDRRSLSVCKYGTSDTLGNVREWCLTEDRDGKHYAMGGSFRDSTGRTFDSVSFSALDRLDDVGFRCARYEEDVELAKSAPTTWRPIPTTPAPIDWVKERFAYEKPELDVSPTDNILFGGLEAKRFSFRTAYGDNERITCYLLLPEDRTIAKPYQVVLGAVDIVHDADGNPNIHNDDIRYYQVMRDQGRAILFPTLFAAAPSRKAEGYRNGFPYPDPNHIDRAENRAVRTANDISRTLDFLEKYGNSYGLDASKVAICCCYNSSLYAPCWLVADEIISERSRIQAAIFPNGGVLNCVQAPVSDQLTFLPYLRVPSLIFSSRASYNIPFEYSQKNFVDLIGTSEKYNFVDNHTWGLPVKNFVREVDEWLTAKMGPPTKIERSAPVAQPSL